VRDLAPPSAARLATAATVVEMPPPRPAAAPTVLDTPPEQKRPTPPPTPPATPAPEPAARPPAAAAGRARIPAWAWWVGALALVIVAVLGLRAVLGGGGDNNPAAGDDGAAATATALALAAAPTATPTDAPTRASTATATPTPTLRPTNTPRPTRTPTVTPTATPASNLPPPNPALGSTWVRPIDGMTLVYVPGGTFPMGSTDGDSDERPVHNVTLDGFWLDRTEVTNAQYARCVAAGECRVSTLANDSDFNGANYPVVGVDWYNAAAYCAWAGGRLPTEAEWEYAARGPEALRYPWGNTQPTCNIANYWGRDGGCVGGTTEVGRYPNGASWVGALDMAGNVWEWVNDWYDSGYYARSPAENPAGPSDTGRKALRGGAWYGSNPVDRAAVRGSLDPTFTDDHVGFRCAQE
jgi:formylglycine-generating enzyme required for sulfatase activity